MKKSILILGAVITATIGIVCVVYWIILYNPSIDSFSDLYMNKDIVGSVNSASVADFSSETFCANQYVQADKAKKIYIPSDPQVEKYLEAWNQILQKNFSKNLIDKYFYISNVEIIDVPNKEIDSEKYFQVDYYIVNDWIVLQDTAGFAIKYKNQEQIAAEDISNYYASYKIDIPWQYSMAELSKHKSDGNRLSDVIAYLQSGSHPHSCEDVFALAESACPDLGNKNFSEHSGEFLSFNGEKNVKKNQCGYGSINIWSKEISCTDSPCVIN